MRLPFTLPFTLGTKTSAVVPITTMADEVNALLAPVASPELEGYVKGIASMFGEVEHAVRGDATHAAWSALLDVNRCPTYLLPFMGQFVGVPVRSSATDAEQRTQITEEGGWKRGRPSSLVAAVMTTLTGAKRVRLIERTTPWAMTVVTSPSETPNVPNTEAVGRAAACEGIVVTFVQTDLPIVDDGTKTIDASTGEIDTAKLANIT